MFKTRVKASALFFVLAALVVSGPIGCTKVKAFFGDNEAIMQLATQAATARVLYEKPEWKQPTIKITDEAIAAIDSGKITTLESVTALVMSKINMGKLKPEEQMLVSYLVQRITVVIAEELAKQGVQNPNKYMVEARKVLGWVNETAKM